MLEISQSHGLGNVLYDIINLLNFLRVFAEVLIQCNQNLLLHLREDCLFSQYKVLNTSMTDWKRIKRFFVSLVPTQLSSFVESKSLTFGVFWVSSLHFYRHKVLFWSFKSFSIDYWWFTLANVVKKIKSFGHLILPKISVSNQVQLLFF